MERLKHTSVIHSGQILRAAGELAADDRRDRFRAGVQIIFDAMASGYGISVTGTMVLTAIMTFFIIWQNWNWKWWQTAALVSGSAADR